WEGGPGGTIRAEDPWRRRPRVEEHDRNQRPHGAQNSSHIRHGPNFFVAVPLASEFLRAIRYVLRTAAAPSHACSRARPKGSRRHEVRIDEPAAGAEAMGRGHRANGLLPEPRPRGGGGERRFLAFLAHRTAFLRGDRSFGMPGDVPRGA